jgi:hypothetical protein
MTEYIIWGIPPHPHEQHEQPLHTQSKTMREAQAIANILEAEHGVTHTRIQVLNMVYNDVQRMFAQSAGGSL